MMTSFLSKIRTKEGFLQKISTEPESTQNSRMFAIKNFEAFLGELYSNKRPEQILDEIRSLQGEERENVLFDILQNWINWNQKRGKNNATIRTFFYNVRKYLYYLGIKTDLQDIKENLKFGKKHDDERYPLSDEEYRNIVNAFSRTPVRQALYLTLGSSGMRIGEALKLRKKDLDFSQERIKINIPANITKTRKGRSTYISKEAEIKLKSILDTLNPEDFIFMTKHIEHKNAPIAEQKNLVRVLDRLGLKNRYSCNNYRKITSHSFRSYFFTKAARKHGENYAHKLVGHGGYLIQYDRMNEEEKLKMYLELEPDLVIFDQSKSELEISRLREENQSIEELREEVKKLRENQAKYDKKILDELRREGILPR